MYRYLFQIFLLFSVLFVGCHSRSEVNEKPNIIVFFVDDMGYNDLEFRNENYETPNIDQFRKESLVFRNAYVPSSTCSPSRVGLLTGQHPARLQFYRYSNPDAVEFNVQEGDSSLLLSRNWLPLEVTTYAEVLRDVGYNTFFTGKWHLGGEEFGPKKQGFEIALGSPHHGYPNNYYPPYYYNEKPLVENTPDDKYLTEFFTDTVVNYINQYNSEKPFLIQFSYHNVHSPNKDDKRFFDIYKEKDFEGIMIFSTVRRLARSISRWGGF